MKDISGICALVPINKLAGMQVSQKGCVEEDSSLTRRELIAIKDRLTRKQRLLKKTLGLDTLSKYRNFIYRTSSLNRKTEVGKSNPRAAIELVEVGRQINIIQDALAEIRKQRKEQAK